MSKKLFPKHVELYRAQLECKIARDAIELQRAPDGVAPMEWAIFNLCHAIDDIAKHLEKIAS